MDAWKSDLLRDLSVSQSPLQSTVSVRKNMTELEEIMSTLPLYSHQFLTIMCDILLEYKEKCGAAFRGLVQSEAEDKRIISAPWVSQISSKLESGGKGKSEC